MSYDHNVVDHRPTKVLVSGYEQDDKADVLTHFEVSFYSNFFIYFQKTFIFFILYLLFLFI